MFVARAAEGRGEVLSSATLIGPVPVPSEIVVSSCIAEVQGQRQQQQQQQTEQPPLHWAVNGVWSLPAARRRGVGQAVMAAAARWASQQAAEAGRDGLLTTIAYETNTAAIAFYEKNGFVRCAGSQPGQVQLKMELPSLLASTSTSRVAE